MGTAGDEEDDVRYFRTALLASIDCCCILVRKVKSSVTMERKPSMAVYDGEQWTIVDFVEEMDETSDEGGEGCCGRSRHFR